MSLVGIIEDGGPHLVTLVLLDAQDALVIVVGRLGAGGIELTALHDDHDAVIATEQTQRAAVALVVDAQDVRIEPHLAVAQRGLACLLERDAVHLVLGDDVAARLLALDGQLGQVDVELQDLEPELGLEGDAQHLGLAVGVGGEPHNLAARLALRDIIDLVGHLNDLELAILVEDDDVVDVGAVAYKLVLLQAGADETVGTVDIEFLVGLGNLAGHDGVKLADDGAARVLGTVFGLQALEPFDGVFGELG